VNLPRLAVLGTGSVALAATRAYASAGGEVIALVSRAAERARAAAAQCGVTCASADPADALAAEVVLVAVTDGALGDVGRRLAALDGAAGPVFLHTSGALSGDALGGEPLRTGSLHPLQTFTGSDPERLAARLPGTHWFHEGAGPGEAKRIVEALGGRFHPLAPGTKTLYHAGAAVLSNHTVALFDTAIRLFEAAGVRPRHSREPLLHLLAGTLANLQEEGLPSALTGPIARGDVETVEAHLAALREYARDLLPSYTALALRAIPLAVAKGGLDVDAAARLELLLRRGPATP
jgi:predicted short-subunit dehydrogenase-like oxidoreductase (DUF2520 family)